LSRDEAVMADTGRAYLFVFWNHHYIETAQCCGSAHEWHIIITAFV